MRASTNRRFASAVLAGALTLAMLAGLAATPVIVRDRFTDNFIKPQFWQTHGFGVLNIAEVNQRLEFSSSSNSSSESYIGLEVKNWGANWKNDFEIEIKYRLNLTNVSGPREVLAGVGLALVGQFPEDLTGFAAAVGRDDVGLFLAIGRYSNGNLVAAQDVDITATQGQLTVEWDRSSDRLTARVGNKVVALNGPWAQFGAAHGNKPMVIGIGCLTMNGNRAISGNRVWMDEFKFEGVKKAR